MTEVYIIFTTGTDYYDRPELFGLYASAEKAEAEAAALRKRTEEDGFGNEEPFFSQVTVSYASVR